MRHNALSCGLPLTDVVDVLTPPRGIGSVPACAKAKVVGGHERCPLVCLFPCACKGVGEYHAALRVAESRPCCLSAGASHATHPMLHTMRLSISTSTSSCTHQQGLTSSSPPSSPATNPICVIYQSAHPPSDHSAGCGVLTSPYPVTWTYDTSSFITFTKCAPWIVPEGMRRVPYPSLRQ